MNTRNSGFKPAQGAAAEAAAKEAAEKAAAEQAAAEAAAKSSASILKVVSNVGLMVHPFKRGVSFRGEEPTELATMDNWTQCQIDNGKLRIVK